jgi:hypothetical protein
MTFVFVHYFGDSCEDSINQYFTAKAAKRFAKKLSFDGETPLYQRAFAMSPAGDDVGTR